jgi:hypothetical protein
VLLLEEMLIFRYPFFGQTVYIKKNYFTLQHISLETFHIFTIRSIINCVNMLNNIRKWIFLIAINVRSSSYCSHQDKFSTSLTLWYKYRYISCSKLNSGLFTNRLASFAEKKRSSDLMPKILNRGFRLAFHI